MQKDLAEFAVKYASKLGASYAEARLEQTKTNGFMLKNGIPEMAGFERISGIGLRIIVNKGLGFASTNKLEKSELKQLVRLAFKTTKAASRIKEEINLAPDKPKKYNYGIKQRLRFADVSPEEKLDLLFEAEKHIHNSNIDAPMRYFTLNDNTTTEYLVNSEGTKVLATVPKASFMYFITLKQGKKTIQRFWQYGCSGGFDLVKKWDIPNLVLNEAKACSENLKKGKKTPKKRMDVVAAPQVVGIMVHESVGHPYEADRIFGREGAQAGESFVTRNMIGHQIGSKIVNVVDDPTLKNSYGFYLFDNEGVKARRKFLIKDGKINEFLHNRQTAYRMGVRSNGSSRSVEYDKESIVRMSNTFLLPGDHKEEELIEGIKEGVYIKNFMEWNIDDRRVNQKYVGAESYLIKNGKLAYPLINPTIEISTFHLWKSVDAIAKNIEHHAGNCGKGEPMQAIPVWFGGPSIRLRNIKLK
ncbi:hypothetical protein A3K72_03615 [Candidatus Woesearchaeota archaeon RBG_13_36_6]|nr:MAG: hypothetical protein A3K72_03615 [Candidatus Woesearchaeota archaeon RBG_13_36_6]